MSYKQINEAERDKITVLINRGWSIRKAAKKLNRNHSSISREIKRNNGKKRYRPHLAQKRAEIKRHNAHKKDLKKLIAHMP